MSQSVRQSRLADAGHVLDQQVAAREQARKTQANLCRLAEDDALERRDGALERDPARGVAAAHGLSSWRTRASCIATAAALRSSSARRSRSAATSAAGACCTNGSRGGLARGLAGA